MNATTLIIIKLERLERKLALADEAEAADRDTYAHIASSMRCLLKSIGLQRRPRGVGPSLSDIIHEGDQP